MDNIIPGILSWIVANSGYPTPPQPPTVDYRPASYFNEQVCEGRVHCAAQAIYVDGTHTIVVNEAYRDLKELRARSLIAHEMVHYLQDLSGRWTEKNCTSWVEREHQAFRLQLLYFAAHGGNPFTHAMPVLNKERCEAIMAAQQPAAIPFQ